MHPAYGQSQSGGMDCAWLAVDADGFVGWIVSCGSAVMPPWIDADVDAQLDGEHAILALPATVEVIAADRSRANRDWLAQAARGIYAYDWSVYTGPYELKARPAQPLAVSALPRAAADVARRTVFAQLRFTDRARIEVADVVACVRG
jgi:hypothetical protein